MSPALLHHDPSLAYLEQYQLGFQQFSELFSLLEPWAFCASKSTLSLWIFRLIDENQDGLINFKEFYTLYGVSFTNKLKFLFKLHLPPFVFSSDPLLPVKPTGRGKVDLQAYLKQWQNEILKKEETIKDLPRINQAQFIQFSKTLYNIFHGHPEEESLYRAVAHVTSLLLRMEEVGRRLQEPSSPPAEAAQPASTAASVEASSTQEASLKETSDASSSHSSQEGAAEQLDPDWSFSFEQVLASLLNEPVIVGFFERHVHIQTKLGQSVTRQFSNM
uniref:EF-hand domain-containing protein n=1 Tax=Xiphophorus couchianus TaxID=32473 RepID=A0A3B5MHE3_9TELE